MTSACYDVKRQSGRTERPVEQYRHNTPAHSSSYQFTSKQTMALILLPDEEIVMFVHLKRVVATDKDIIHSMAVTRRLNR